MASYNNNNTPFSQNDFKLYLRGRENKAPIKPSLSTLTTLTDSLNARRCHYLSANVFAQQMLNSIWPAGRRGGRTNTNRTTIQWRDSLSCRADKRADTKKFLRAFNQNKTWICIIYKYSPTNTDTSHHLKRCPSVCLGVCELNGCNDKRQNSNCGYLVRKAFDVLYAQAMNF